MEGGGPESRGCWQEANQMVAPSWAMAGSCCSKIEGGRMNKGRAMGKEDEKTKIMDKNNRDGQERKRGK